LEHFEKRSADKKNYRWWACLAIALIVALDQVAKLVARVSLKPMKSVRIIPSLIEFRYTENTGASFSMLSGQTWLFILVSSVFSCVLIYIIIARKINNGWLITAAAFMTAGGLGNLWDRIFNGYVVDYIFIYFFPAIFNVADIFITLGAVICAIEIVVQICKGTAQKKSLEQ
jgi:signal peptidase II